VIMRKEPGQIAPTVTVRLQGADLEAMGDAFVKLARLDLQRNPDVPPLYKAGVRYVREASTERWQLPSETWKRKAGDCEDLAVWRVAELRQAGEPAKLYLRQSGPRLWHAMVKRADGTLEDPSKKLGMKGRA